MAHVQWTSAPDTGFWRIGRSPDPIRFSPAPEPEALDSPTAGNRFDSPTRGYSVCYFATQLAGCFGETLARFRPDPALAAVAAERNPDGNPTYAGIRYLSRLNTSWECWAVFDRVKLTELERRPILQGDEALAGVASTYGLRVF
jgi:hypothetical protein